MELKKHHLSLRKQNSFLSLICTVAIPTVVLCVILFLIAVAFCVSLINQEKQAAISDLRSISASCEESLSALTSTAEIFSELPQVSEVLNSRMPILDADLSDSLSRLYQSYPLIRNAYIYNKRTDTVYTENGTVKLSAFFENDCVYENYNANYWKKLRFYNTNPSRILSPCVLTVKEKSFTTVPFVYHKIISQDVDHYIIFDIDLQKLLHSYSYKSNRSSSIYINNRYTKKIFSSDNTETPEFSQEFLKALLQKPNGDFRFRLSTGDATIATYSSNHSMVGYTYFIIIPTKNIIRSIFPNILFYMLTALVCILTTLILTLKNTSNLYLSLTKIRNLLSESHEKREVNLLQDILDLSIKANSSKKQLNNTLSYAQEKYLASFLNSTEQYITEDAKKSICSSIQFPNSYFLVLFVHFVPLENFFDNFSSADYQIIKDGLYHIIKSMFSSFVSYTLPMSNDVLDIIINLDKEERLSEVHRICNELFEYLKYDRSLMDVQIEMSSLYSDIADLKMAHSEAINISPLASLSSPLVSVENKTKSILTSKDESMLQNAFLSKDRDMIAKAFTQLLKKNNASSARAQKRVYNFILNVLLKFIRMKKIEFRPGKLDFEIMNDVLNQPPEAVYAEIWEMIEETILTGGEEKDARGSIQEIIEYINKHYFLKSLSLQYLSDIFHTNSSTLSVSIKNETGLNYIDYLNKLRVEKSKELLIHTDKNIDDICDECGFVSRQTFFRVFKSTVGMTSGEFKKLYKK